ncbi:MAG: tRNA nucleotidyltransferase/poly(A) polymerase family protein [Candidatus Xenobia bacterium]
MSRIRRNWLESARRAAPLEAVLAEAGDVPVWLVGGAVRQALLGQPWSDLDFAVKGDALALAKRLARRVGFSFVLLDETRRIARAVPSGQGLGMDFASLVGDTLTSDLMQRDLTVNAMAIALESFLHDEAPPIVDPCGGLQDLQAKLVRIPSESVLVDDPLRLLRVYRFAAQLRFEVDAITAGYVARHAARLQSISPERVRDELFKVLKVPNANAPWRGLSQSGLLEVVFPGQSFTLTLPEPAPQPCLDTPLVEGRTRRHLLKLVALLQRPATMRDIAEGLKLSTREVRAAERMARCTPPSTPSPEAAAAFFAEAGEESMACMLLCDASPELLPLYEAWQQAPLLRGDEVASLLGISGPPIGEALHRLRTAQMTGEVQDKPQAAAFLVTDFESRKSRE